VYAALGREELERIVDAHRKGFADALALEQDRQVSGLKRLPPQTSHNTWTSGRKFISMRCIP